MKIAAWNLNHRIRAKAIPPSAAVVIRELAPDVLVLTEFVDGEDRGSFKQALCEMGLGHISISAKSDKHNQVLVASRLQHAICDFQTPLDESHAITNLLSVSFSEEALTIVGMRVPAYESSLLVKKYWERLGNILETIGEKRLVIIGDLNGDPDSDRSIGGRTMKALRDRGWIIPTPTGPWSYISSDGKRNSKVDHVMASPSAGAVSAAYLDIVDNVVVAGPKARNPISDHAILVCEIQQASKQNELILKIGAEGGGIYLYGVRTGAGWLFSREVIDHTPELIDEPPIEHTSAVVNSWPAALKLLDENVWFMLRPLEVHVEFRKAIMDAVLERRGATGPGLSKWKALCEGPASPPTTHSP